MKTYTVTFMASGTLTIPASSEKEAREMFNEYYQEDALRELAMNNIEVTDVQTMEAENESTEPEMESADNDMHAVDGSDGIVDPTHNVNGKDINAKGDDEELTVQSILQGLDDLIDDRKSFLTDDPDPDDFFNGISMF